MMDLVEGKPPSIRVPKTVPPVKEKRSDKPAYKPFDKRETQQRKIEDRDIKNLYP
jgi:hypothetical protein